ncbi:TIGR04222 domain-containing membrane protein [Actinomadura sp.]|uniref:TIGR04222 domain-containing membrane protein n=1 Tax=Actinomadura sp. TaxID=1989 RepID=UPI0037C98A59
MDESDHHESDDHEFDRNEFDHYELAHLCGGPVRVVQTAVLALDRARRIRMSRGTHRVDVVRRESEDPVQAAVLAAIPRSGRLLGQVIEAAARAPETAEAAARLAEAGLVRRGSAKLTRRGRAVRRGLVRDGADEASALRRFAVIGPAGVEDARLREILESGDPKPIKLPHPRWHGHRLESSGHSGLGYSGYDSGGDGGGSDGGGY